MNNVNISGKHAIWKTFACVFNTHSHTTRTYRTAQTNVETSDPLRGPPQQDAFDKVKIALASAPVLHCMAPTKTQRSQRIHRFMVLGLFYCMKKHRTHGN